MGIILIIFGLFAFFYYEEFIKKIYLYREYALPLAVLGFIILGVSYTLPSRES
jgi:hypothetical protein